MLPLLLSLALLAADPPAAPSPIRLPVISRVVTPAPMPAPDTPVAFAAGTVYAFDSSVKCSVRAYPAGCVTVAEKKGPRDISAKFVGGTGEDEDRSFDGPFVYVVRATHAGCVELVITPFGFKSEDEVRSVKFDVLGGCKVGPVTPVVDPLQPLTDLQRKLKDAVTADGAAKASVALYAALYRQAARTTVLDAGIATGADLLAEVQRAVKQLGIPAGSLNKTARAVADELDLTLSKLGTLDPLSRATAQAAFLTVATALEVVANGQ